MTYALIALSALAAALLLELRDTRRRLSEMQTAYYAAAHRANRQKYTAAYWQARALQAEKVRVWSLNDLIWWEG
jgi:hypothetical protein